MRTTITAVTVVLLATAFLAPSAPASCHSTCNPAKDTQNDGGSGGDASDDFDDPTRLYFGYDSGYLTAALVPTLDVLDVYSIKTTASTTDVTVTVIPLIPQDISIEVRGSSTTYTNTFGPAGPETTSFSVSAGTWAIGLHEETVGAGVGLIREIEDLVGYDICLAFCETTSSSGQPLPITGVAGIGPAGSATYVLRVTCFPMCSLSN